MHPILRNILAVIASLFIGGLCNIGLIALGEQIIPVPPGANLSTPQGWQEALPLLGSKHYIFPFLAHAAQSFIGGFMAAKLGVGKKMLLALIVGAFSLVGGILAIFMIPAPSWFKLVDLLLAYIPVAYLGGKMGMGKNNYINSC